MIAIEENIILITYNQESLVLLDDGKDLTSNKLLVSLADELIRNPEAIYYDNFNGVVRLDMNYIKDNSVGPLQLVSCRKKFRYQFSLQDYGLPMVLDMTIVRYDTANTLEGHEIVSNGRLHYEVEIEMDSSDILTTSNNNNDEMEMEIEEEFTSDMSHHNECKWFTDFLVFSQSIGKYLTRTLLNPFIDIGLRRSTVLDSMEMFRKDHEFHYQNIKSSLPMALGWESVSSIDPEQYFIAEKSDGIRYLLYVTKDGRYYFFSRSMRHVFEVCRGFHRIGKLKFSNINSLQSHILNIGKYFSLENGPYLLDGEMTRMTESDRPIYIIFDILFAGGMDLTTLPLTDRLSVLAKNYTTPLPNDPNGDWVIALKQLYRLNAWNILQRNLAR